MALESQNSRNMLKRLKPHDCLIVKSIDRLGRNYNDTLVEWQRITKEIGADILVLDMDLLDTREKNGSLTGTLISDMVLQIMAYFARLSANRSASGRQRVSRRREPRENAWGVIPPLFRTILKRSALNATAVRCQYAKLPQPLV